MNLAPTSTGSATAIGEIFPELKVWMLCIRNLIYYLGKVEWTCDSCAIVQCIHHGYCVECTQTHNCKGSERNAPACSKNFSKRHSWVSIIADCNI